MTNFKGLWIPAEVLLDKELSDKEKIIFSMILYLSQNENGCFASNRYIANIVNVTSDRVSKIVSKLKDKGYISVKLKYKNNSKEIESRRITLIGENNYTSSCKELYPIGKSNETSSSNRLYPIGRNDKDIKKYITNKNNYIQREYSDEDFEKYYINCV